MINQTKYFEWTHFLCVALLCAAFQGATAGTAVLAPETAGSAMSFAGETWPEGSTIKTGAEAGKFFSPLPGVTVTVGRGTSVSLLRAAVAKTGDATMSREVLLKLDVGTIAFAVDKRIASQTTFDVQTPLGRKSAQGLTGTITVEGKCVKVACLTGKIMFTARGFQTPILIKAGRFLAICGDGPDAEIRVIDAIARTWTDYSADGTPLATRDATVAELESTRGFFEAALANASAAEGAGLLGPDSAAEITLILTKLNQSFAIVGIAAVEGSSIGTSPKPSSTEYPNAPSPTGFAGGPANPANTSGAVNSPER